MMLAAVLAAGAGAMAGASRANQPRARQSEAQSKAETKKAEAPGKTTETSEAAKTRTPIPADAIALGAKMAELAPANFLRWARGYAKRILKNDAAAPRETVTQEVEKRYAKAPAKARAAGELLVWYLAYVNEADKQTSAAARLSDLDREVQEAEQDLHLAERTPNLRGMASPGNSAEARALLRLERVREQRDFYRGHMAQLQTRLDGCLERLAAAHEAVKGGDAAAVKGLK
jgi:hypothetical protein